MRKHLSNTWISQCPVLQERDLFVLLANTGCREVFIFHAPARSCPQIFYFYGVVNATFIPHNPAECKKTQWNYYWYWIKALIHIICHSKIHTVLIYKTIIILHKWDKFWPTDGCYFHVATTLLAEFHGSVKAQHHAWAQYLKPNVN